MAREMDAWLPWLDRSGRVSRLRAVVFAALWIPPAILLARTLLGDLGPRPLTEAIHVSGDWAARMLVLTLSLTPLHRVSERSELAGVRRMIGLSAFFLAALHVVLYCVDQNGAAGVIVTEILVRPYLTIGFVAVLGLTALAVTSTDGSIRRLGAPLWRRLHGLVHPIAILALCHVFLQSKLDLAQGAILTGVAFGGLAIRIAAERGAAGSPLAGLVATAAAAVAAGLSEVVWFAVRSGRSPMALIVGNLDASFRWPPSWVAAAIVGCAFVVARLLRRRRPERRSGNGRVRAQNQNPIVHAENRAVHTPIPAAAIRESEQAIADTASTPP